MDIDVGVHHSSGQCICAYLLNTHTHSIHPFIHPFCMYPHYNAKLTLIVYSFTLTTFAFAHFFRFLKALEWESSWLKRNSPP